MQQHRSAEERLGQHLQLAPGAFQLVPVLLDVGAEGVGELLGVLCGLHKVPGLLQLWLQIGPLSIQIDGLQWFQKMPPEAFLSQGINV